MPPIIRKQIQEDEQRRTATHIYWKTAEVSKKEYDDNGRLKCIFAKEGRILGPIGYIESHSIGEGSTHKQYWLVHILSQFPIVRVGTEKDAITFAEYLVKEFRTAFEVERSETIKLLPDWVQGWIKKCGRERKWIDPIIGEESKPKPTQIVTRKLSTIGLPRRKR